MRISNHYYQQTNALENEYKGRTMSGFSEIMNKVDQNAKSKSSGVMDCYTKSASISDFSIYTRNELISQELELPIETERYLIEDASNLEGVPAYLITDKMAGKGLYIREDQLNIQRDEKTGMEFMFNPDFDPLAYNVRVTDELKSLIYDLADKRNVDVKEIPLQGDVVINKDPKTGLEYMTILGNEGCGVSVIIKSDKDIETINKLIDEFQKYPVSSQRGTAELYALLEISGNLRREEKGFTFLTPNGITYIPYDGNSEKGWEIDISPEQYSIARKYLAEGTGCTKLGTWTAMLPGIRVYLEDELESVGNMKSNCRRDSFCFGYS